MNKLGLASLALIVVALEIGIIGVSFYGGWMAGMHYNAGR